MLNIIKSEDNKKIKFLKSLKQKKIRLRESTYILEGIKTNIEAINEGANIIEIFMSESFFEKEFSNYSEFKNITSNIVEDRIFDKITDTVNSQGIISTVKAKLFKMDDIMPFGKYILVDALSDPGNLGGIIRGIDAFNFDGIIIGPNTVDVLNEKVIRSTMASIFRVKIFMMKDISEMEILKKLKFRIITTTLKDGSKSPMDTDLKNNIVLIIGNEANGVSKEMEDYSSDFLHIPIEGGAESLNANVSASILMYESLRQRRK